jgi:hypothetical protein
MKHILLGIRFTTWKMSVFTKTFFVISLNFLNVISFCKSIRLTSNINREATKKAVFLTGVFKKSKGISKTVCFVIAGFELRNSHLPGRCSYLLSHSSTSFL